MFLALMILKPPVNTLMHRLFESDPSLPEDKATELRDGGGENKKHKIKTTNTAWHFDVYDNRGFRKDDEHSQNDVKHSASSLQGGREAG